MKNSILPAFLVFLATSLFSTLTVHADSLAWTNGGTNADWNNANNWTPVQIPAAGDTLTLGNGAPDAAQAITISGTAFVQRLSLDATGSRTYSVSDSVINFQNVTANPDIRWSNSPGRNDVTINSDILLSHTTSASNANLVITSGAGDATLTINGDISGSTEVGVGARTWSFSSANQLILNGANTLDSMIWSFGEIVVGNTAAMGSGLVRLASSGTATLSLRSDLSIDSYATGKEGFFRISEAVSGGTTDRTVTVAGRLTALSGADQKITFLDNVNSTGTLTLLLNDTDGTAHNVGVDLNSTGLLRFGQAGDKTFSAIISGDGKVDVASSGTTTFTEINTYTGETTISTGTLLLSGAGSISASSKIDVASGATLSVADITGPSYTFEAGQTLSGEGTVATGGKNLTLNGTLAPGSSPGTLTVDLGAGTFSLGANTDLQFELGTASDLVDLTTGILDIGTGTLGFDDFSFTAGAGFGVGEYILFQTTESILGSFAGTTGTVGGLSSELLFNGNNLVLNVVPEPGTALLLLGGLSVLLVRRKRR